MANELDEMKDPVLEEGRETGVINKQLEIKVGWGTKFFEILMFFPGILFLFIPTIIWVVSKIKAGNRLSHPRVV